MPLGFRTHGCGLFRWFTFCPTWVGSLIHLPLFCPILLPLEREVLWEASCHLVGRARKDLKHRHIPTIVGRRGKEREKDSAGKKQPLAKSLLSMKRTVECMARFQA